MVELAKNAWQWTQWAPSVDCEVGINELVRNKAEVRTILGEDPHLTNSSSNLSMIVNK